MEVTIEELNNYANLPPENKARFLELRAEEDKEKEIEDKKKNSPYQNWLQVNNSNESYKAESWLVRNSPVAYQVLRFLAKEMDNFNALVCSFKVMEEALGYKRNALSRAVHLLKEHGYIDIKKSGTANVYLINKELYWKSWGKNYRYAEFSAKIVIAESEQESVKTETTKHKTATISKKGKVKTVKNTVVSVSEKPVADTKITGTMFTTTKTKVADDEEEAVKETTTKRKSSKGRTPKPKPADWQELKTKILSGEITKKSVWQSLKISSSTLNKWLAEE